MNAAAKAAPIIHIIDDVNGDRNSHIGRVFAGVENTGGWVRPKVEPVYADVPLADTPPYRKYPRSKPGCRTARVTIWGNHIFLGYDGWHGMPELAARGEHYAKRVDGDALVAKVERVTEKAYTREITRPVKPTDRYYTPHEKWPLKTSVAQYDSPNGGARIANQWLKFRFTMVDGTQFEAEFAFEFPLTGKATVDPQGRVTCEVEFYGATRSWGFESLQHKVVGGYGELPAWITLYRHLQASELPQGATHWWRVFLSQLPQTEPDTKGISSVLKKKANKPCFETLAADHPVEWAFLQWLMSGRTQDKFTNNKFLRSMFEGAEFDPAKIAEETRHLMANVPKNISCYGSSYDKELYLSVRRELCKAFTTAKETIRLVEEKTDYTKRRGNSGKADGLGVTADLYPKLRAAMEAGDIPASCFSNPDKAPINREFALWERALKQKGWADAIYSIAQDAGRRSTYQKDITPYLAFLFKLPKYLDRHTPGRKKWACFPKYVESEWELEMGNDGEGPNENGTSKRRSAFTPVADNETRVVTVPYVAVCVTGRFSQWCYSKEYYVFESMMVDPVSRGVVVNEIEEKLNGRDDYGLMFYTLNGSATAQGYPTFLIIFERREQTEKSTFVHFHRVHPKRKKNGQWTPACTLIERTYQYMAGNIPAKDVMAQQGDMVYIAHGHDPLAAGAKVEDEPKGGRQLDFESHNHVALGDEGEIKLHVSTASTPKNRLGFLQVPEGGMAVRHPEHDDIQYLPEGWYEVRRCRSWEANPRAIWSMTID
jgi:hypothetical protein